MNRSQLLGRLERAAVVRYYMKEYLIVDKSLEERGAISSHIVVLEKYSENGVWLEETINVDELLDDPSLVLYYLTQLHFDGE